MKKLIVVFGLGLILAGLSFTEGVAQSKKNGPPDWAPAHGYRAKTRHIYFPDNNFYYDVQKGTYIYLNGGNWQVSAKLPSIFNGVNLKVATQVELDIDTDSPQKFNADHKVKYKGNNGNSKSNGNPGKGNKKK